MANAERESWRLATIDDVPLLHPIAVAHANVIRDQRGGPQFLVDEVANQADFDTWFANHLDSDRSLVLTGTYAGVPLGYLVASLAQRSDGTTQAKVDALLVDPEAREVGIGELLMNEAVAWAREKGCAGMDAFALPGDRWTKNFFESFGLKARLLTVTIDLTGSD